MKHALSVLCTSATIQEGNGTTKSTTDAAVCLEGWDLFVDGSRWRFKLKEMTELTIDGDVIDIVFDNKTKAAVQLNVSSENETKAHGAFVKRLTAYHDKIRNKEKRAGFGGNAGGSTRGRSNKAQSHRMPWDDVEEMSRNTKQNNRTSVEGKKPTFDTPEEQKPTSSDSPPFSSSKKSSLRDGTHNEDDREEVPMFDVAATPPMLDKDVSMADEVQDEEDDLPRKKIMKKRRIIIDDDEEDDQDCLFTTPAATNIVSPWTTAAPTIMQKDDHRNVDEQASTTSSVEEEETSVVVTTLKNQPRISQFFVPAKASMSPIKTKQSKVTTSGVLTPILSPRIKTPERQPTSARRKVIFPSASSRKYSASRRSMDMVNAAERKKGTNTTSTMGPSTWLLNSQAERALSSAQKRRDLYLSSQTTELSSDPIEDERDGDTVEVKTSPLTKRKWVTSADKHRQSGRSGKTILSTSNNVQYHRHGIWGVASNLPDQVDELPRYRGLRNLGNTCYMNSSLQMLYSCRRFMTALQQSSGGELVQSVCDIYRELQGFDLAATTSPAQPNQIKHAIDKKTEKFLGYEQRDAHEFLADLIDHLDMEIKSSINDGGEITVTDTSRPTDTARPTDDFCLTVRAHLQCTSCGYLRHKDEMHRCLSVDIVEDPKSGEASIESSVRQFFEPELREIKCEKCEDGTHANQSLSIATFPKILLLHLKRFIFVEQPVSNAVNSIGENKEPNSPEKPVVEMEYVFQKNKAQVDVSPTIDLTKFLLESKSPASYDLKSIVRHIGRMASSGHYTADAVRPNEPPGESNEDIFVSFDDHRSRRTTLEHVVGKRRETPYMIMYELKV